MLDGETAFKLYDTYGFPLDLTQDALRQRGIAVDLDGFDAAMAAPEGRGARELGRLGRGGDRDGLVRACARRPARPSSSATTPRQAEGVVAALVKDGAAVDSAGAGDDGRRRRQPDAVLRRVRRPGGRHRRDLGRGRPLRRRPTRRRRRDGALRPCRQGRRRARSRSAPPSSSRSITRAARGCAPTIRRRICCTRRCARCSARMSRRRARWSRPTACASTSRIRKPITAEELEQVEAHGQRDRRAERAGRRRG